MLIATKVKKSLKQCKSSNLGKRCHLYEVLEQKHRFSTKISPRWGFNAQAIKTSTRLAFGEG
jgi:hypothetical protein